MVLKRTVWYDAEHSGLASKAVQGLALSLQSIDDIHCRNSLALSMLSICNCISDHIFQEVFKHSSGFLIYKSADTLHTTSACVVSACVVSERARLLLVVLRSPIDTDPEQWH